MSAPSDRRRCIDCPPDSRREAPEPGPRCKTHRRDFLNAKKVRDREARVFRLYGVTPEEFRALKVYQNGLCGICGKPLTKTREPDLDHDHKCKVCNGADKACGQCARGVVHGKCNRFLAYIEDNIDSAESLVRYLQDPPLRRMREGR